MHHITQQQAQILWDNYRFLSELGGPGPESLSQALTDLCEGLDPETARQDMDKLCSGIQLFRETYTVYTQDSTPDLPQAIQSVTRNLTEQQRKGLYLQCFEFLRASDAKQLPEAQNAQSAAELAAQPEEAILALLSEQLQNFSQQLAGDAMASTQSSAPAEPADPLLFAAAAYAAGVNGDLPECFQQYPEMVGACAAAREALSRDLPQTGEETEERWKEAALVVIEAVLIAAAIAVLFAGLCALVYVAAGASCAVMEFIMSLGTGALHGMLASVLELCLFGLAITAGVATELAVVSLPGLGICLAEAGWEKARSFYDRHKSVVEKIDLSGPSRQEDPLDLEDEDPRFAPA